MITADITYLQIKYLNKCAVITLTCVSASLCWSPVALAIKATGFKLEVVLTSTWDVEEKGYNNLTTYNDNNVI